MGQRRYGIRYMLVVMSILGPHVASGFGVQDEFTLSLDLLSIETSRGADDTATFTAEAVQWLSLPGEPAIPWQVVNALLPQDAVLGAVTVVLSRAQFSPVEGMWDVAPMPAGRLPRAGGDASGNQADATLGGETHNVGIYAADRFWPASDVRAVSTGQYRRWKIAQVAVPLFRYNPVQKKLEQLVRGELDVWFERAVALQTEAQSGPSDRIGGDVIKGIVSNYESQKPSYQPRAASDIRMAVDPKPGYVIITTTDILATSRELGRFIAHKEARGFAVWVVTEEEFGGGVGDVAAENIRSWLQRHYLVDDLEYILLVGNPHPYQGRIPMKMLWPMNDGDTSCMMDEDAVQKHSPSDYYYADLNGDWDLDGDGFYGEWRDDFGAGGVDRCWDVRVGRIPCYEQLDARGQVIYDSGPPRLGLISGERFYRASLCGDLGPGKEQRWCAEPFAIPKGRGRWRITGIDADYWLDNRYDRDFDFFGYIIWRRQGQSRPQAEDIIRQGMVPAPLHRDDPRLPGSENWLHQVPVDFQLDGGDYYLTIYGERSDGQSGCALSWMRNTEFGIPLLDPDSNPNPGVRAFAWRSQTFPEPGFCAYNLSADRWSAAPDQDARQIYTNAFAIYGEPAATAGSSAADSQVPDVASLDHILAKIIAYENAREETTPWRRSMLLAMNPDDAMNPSFFRMGEEIRKTIVAFKAGWDCFRIYEREYGLSPPPELTPCTTDNVVGSWSSSPFGVVVWHTHGLPTEAVDVMNHLRAARLNDRYPAFTFQISCLTAHPETVDNLAYTLLKNGAVATVGATRTAPALVSHDTFTGTPLSEGLAIEYLTRLIRYEQDAGRALYDAKRMLVPQCNVHWLAWCDYNLYGCPAVGVYSCRTEP